jgi:hypothetical protein
MRSRIPAVFLGADVSNKVVRQHGDVARNLNLGIDELEPIKVKLARKTSV